MPNIDEIQISELVGKCRLGDTEAFRLLIKNYKRNLFSYLFKLSGDKTIAEDLFQETIIKVWYGIKKYREESKFSSWLFSIAHNVSIDALRKKHKRKNIVNSDDITEGTDTHNPHNIVVAGETMHLIQQAVNALPEKQKRVFLLRQHGGLAFKEIAKITNEPLNTVLGHMHYSVKKIKKALREENVL